MMAWNRLNRRNSVLFMAAALMIQGTNCWAQPANVNAVDGSPSDVTITVKSGGRQALMGTGTSQNNYQHPYQQLSSDRKEMLNSKIWSDLQLDTFRLWFQVPDYAPTPDARNITPFADNFVNSGMIADAQAHGVQTLLLAPEGIPSYMKGQDGYLLPEQAASYAHLLADAIHQLQQDYDVNIGATGISNEPGDMIAPDTIAAIIISLRADLDAYGLTSVKIVAPELANNDGKAESYLDTLKSNSAAWNALDAFSTHSYNMAVTDAIADKIKGTGKEFWITEAGNTGPLEPHDGLKGASLASRFLNDMNHEVTHWIWFLGYEAYDPNDNGTRLIGYNPADSGADGYTVYQQYYYYHQLTDTFDKGAVFRDSESSLEGDMTWTYGKKPQITAAAAQNPDGTWGIGISNYTDDGFDSPGCTAWWCKDQGGNPAQAFNVTVNVEELAGSGDVTFDLFRSNDQDGNQPEGQVTAVDGKITIPNVAPHDLITLRSVNPTNLQAPSSPQHGHNNEGTKE